MLNNDNDRNPQFAFVHDFLAFENRSMGSKTPEGHQQTPDGSDSVDFKAVNPDFKLSRNASSSANLGSGDIGGGDDDDDADAKEEAGISVVGLYLEDIPFCSDCSF